MQTIAHTSDRVTSSLENHSLWADLTVLSRFMLALSYNNKVNGMSVPFLLCQLIFNILPVGMVCGWGGVGGVSMYLALLKHRVYQSWGDPCYLYNDLHPIFSIVAMNMADIFYFCVLMMAHGPAFVQATIHGIILNTVQSLASLPEVMANGVC